jgi:hypothetical protein
VSLDEHQRDVDIIDKASDGPTVTASSRPAARSLWALPGLLRASRAATCAQRLPQATCSASGRWWSRSGSRTAARSLPTGAVSSLSQAAGSTI